MALDKDLWLAYHCYLHLGPHLNHQILDLSCLAHFLVRLLGCELALNKSGVGVATVALRISMKLISGGVLFLSSLPMGLLSHLT